MKQIIVPTDFSKGAWNALLYALDIGEALGIREILILNSYYAPHAGASTLGSIDRVMQQDSENGLREWTNKIKEAGLSAKFNFHSKSVHATLVEGLNSQVHDYNDSLIVIGSLGHTGAVDKIFGSNASDVAAESKCPVMVIPAEAKYTSCKELVLGSDFDQIDERNLRILKTIDALDPSTKLKIVRVVNKSKPLSTADGDGISQDDLPHSTLEISGDNVSNALDEYVSNNRTDLLVLIKKETGFFESMFHRSVTKKLALLAHVPLLVLKRVA
ncbi:MAG: hypothetical protein DHS20C17_16470 [Cyclobacteriaceae bacterium]|nr:MAG: hypothetical protein DHS20C17_16470 [Cyclobacteriaceae bacterium]